MHSSTITDEGYVTLMQLKQVLIIFIYISAQLMTLADYPCNYG